MYSVMKAVYDSGIPISFKGSMVLKACLFEAGFLDETRHTVDIDANWNTDTPPTAEQMVESLQRAINRGGMDYEVRLYRMYGEKRSAGFELVDRNTDEILFTMDVDVNRPITPTQIYEVDGICFRGVSPLQMIADKVAVVSTDSEKNEIGILKVIFGIRNNRVPEAVTIRELVDWIIADCPMIDLVTSGIIADGYIY